MRIIPRENSLNEFVGLERCHDSQMELFRQFSETLRRYPPTVALFRVAAKTYRVPGDNLIIEKGQLLLIPMHALHNDPEYYPDPGVFDPERFSPEQIAKRPKGTYLPFSDGPRICIGERFRTVWRVHHAYTTA